MLAWHRQQDTWSLVDRFIAPSRFLRDRFVAAGWDPAKIVVKPHFVPGLFADEASPTEGRGRFAMYAGRLSPEKGIRTLIAAWALLPREIPLYVFGDGPLRAEMESTVAASGANVKFFGWLSRAELLDYDRRARMLIYPSECFESFALGITEAFACGTPVICSRLGAMEEMVQHGSTGWHFTAGRAEELSRMVRTLWENPPVLDAVGRAALAEFRARFTADRNHDLLLEIYRAAIEKNQGAECLRPDEVAA